MYCIKCGAALKDSAVTCEKCGEQVGKAKGAISYDYLTIQAEGKTAYEVIDSYQSLGWEVVDRAESFLLGHTTINLRRNRKIKNKEQLNRLQVKLDDCFNSISVFEKCKTQSAMVVSLILGIIGTLIFGGGLSMFLTWENPEIWVYIVGGALAVIGAIPCSLAYFVYTKIRAKKTVAMNIQIEQKRDEIGNLCEDGQKFLA